MAQENSEQISRWARTKSILSAAALLLSIIGSIAMAGGGALWLWADDLRDFGLGVMGVGLVILSLQSYSQRLMFARLFLVNGVGSQSTLLS